jgi:sugar O-acyltransferase (sialic acid O-acetyltransferase NeuD family)
VTGPGEPRRVVVVGTGTFARMARRYLEGDTVDRVVAFAVHRDYVTDAECDGLPVVPLEELPTSHPPSAFPVLVGVGYTRVNRDRSALLDEVAGMGYELVTYVSRSAIVWPGTDVGAGCFLFEGVIVQPGVSLGEGTVIWSGSVVNHDTTIERCCFLASNVVVSGHVTLGHHTFVGANATLRDGVRTGAHCVVGAGAVITRDTAERSVHAVPGTTARGDDAFDLGRL